MRSTVDSRSSNRAPAKPERLPATSRIPLNTLAIPFGLLGFAGCWSTARIAFGYARVAQVFWIIATVALVQASLAVRRLARDDERRGCGDGFVDHDLIFSQIDGNPLRPGSITGAFEAHVKACGLPPIRLHETRHGACSLLLAGGVPIEIVQLILGHSSPTVTRRIYAHVMKKATAEQVETASQLITKHRRDQSVTKPSAGPSHTWLADQRTSRSEP